jgi:hypothetical protein
MRSLASLVLICAAGALGCDGTTPPLSPTDVDRHAGGSPAHVEAPEPAPAPPQAPVAGPPPAQPSGNLPLAGPVDEGAVVIERGELDFEGRAGRVTLRGTRDFTLKGTVDATFGVIAPIQDCQGPSCEPDLPISLRAVWSGMDLDADVTLGGVSYTTGSALDEASAFIEFGGSVIAPPFTKRGSDQITAPFTFTGQFFTGGEPPAAEVVPLRGGGVAKLWLRQPAGSTRWQVDRVLYRFKRQRPATASSNTPQSPPVAGP